MEPCKKKKKQKLERKNKQLLSNWPSNALHDGFGTTNHEPCHEPGMEQCMF